MGGKTLEYAFFGGEGGGKCFLLGEMGENFQLGPHPPSSSWNDLSLMSQQVAALYPKKGHISPSMCVDSSIWGGGGGGLKIDCRNFALMSNRYFSNGVVEDDVPHKVK